MSAHMNRKLMI